LTSKDFLEEDPPLSEEKRRSDLVMCRRRKGRYYPPLREKGKGILRGRPQCVSKRGRGEGGMKKEHNPSSGDLYPFGKKRVEIPIERGSLKGIFPFRRWRLRMASRGGRRSLKHVMRGNNL